jgi:Spy/CpxP family protein refolding chaperone
MEATMNQIDPTNQQDPSSRSSAHCTHQSKHPHSGHRLGKAIFVMMLAIASGFTGGFVSKAYAQEHRAMKQMDRDGKMEQRVTRMVKHMAVEIDATPEQTQKLTTIALAAAKDLAPVREKLNAARKKGMTLLSAPQIDRQAMEQLRVEQIAMMDSNSKRLMQALADTAEVLTPAQREKLAERMKKRGQHWGKRFGHHGGMGGH